MWSYQKERFDRANLVIRSMILLAVEVLGGLTLRLVHQNFTAVDGLKLSLFDECGSVEESVV